MSGFFMRVKDGFQNYFEYMRQKGLTEKTIREHRRFLFGAVSHSLLIDKKIKHLKIADVASVIEAGRTHGEHGPTRAICTLRRYLKFLKESGEKIPFDWREIEVPKVAEKEQDFLTETEFNNFVEKISLHTLYGLRDRTLYEILFSTGARISEILSLNKNGIDLENREVKIKGAKGENEGWLYFSERSLSWLKRYLATRGDECPDLFITYNPQKISRLSSCVARKHLLKYRKEFGFTKQITHHSLRRSFCSLLLDKGATIKEVQHLARHKSPRTTLKFYAKVEIRKAKETHQRIMNEV